MASRDYSNVEVKVGVFVAFSGALFVTMLMMYGRMAPVWRGRTEIHVAFSDVAGLRPDAPVRYNGVEVGRVKSMTLLHLDDDGLRQLPVLEKHHLENLPLWPESIIRELRQVAEEDFNAKCRRALKDRTMIELRLEVLQEGDAKRYRLDDQIRIVSTVFGDCAIEIISGNGAVNATGPSRMIVGLSGDFFSNLAKSMGDVKEILSGVTDVVGNDERRSFERASTRLAKITGKVDNIRAVAGVRAEATAKKADALGGHISKTLSEAGDSLEQLEPQAKAKFESMKVSVGKTQGSLQDVQDESRLALKEVADEITRIRVDISFIVDQSKPNFEEMKTNMQSAYEKMGGLSEHLEIMQSTAGSVVTQSEPDLARGRVSFKNSLSNLKDTSLAANENKDLMLSNRDLGEYEYHSALDIYRKLSFASRHLREAEAEVQETLYVLADVPGEPALTRWNVELIAPLELIAKSKRVLEKLGATRKPVEQLRDWVEMQMLPPFERKKTLWD